MEFENNLWDIKSKIDQSDNMIEIDKYFNVTNKPLKGMYERITGVNEIKTSSNVSIYVKKKTSNVIIYLLPIFSKRKISDKLFGVNITNYWDLIINKPLAPGLYNIKIKDSEDNDTDTLMATFITGTLFPCNTILLLVRESEENEENEKILVTPKILHKISSYKSLKYKSINVTWFINDFEEEVHKILELSKTCYCYKGKFIELNNIYIRLIYNYPNIAHEILQESNLNNLLKHKIFRNHNEYEIYYGRRSEFIEEVFDDDNIKMIKTIIY